MLRLSLIARGSKRKNSSAAFVARQMFDPWVQKARAEGYVCRSAYKLIEIDDRLKLFANARTAVVDLGSSPGGWSQVIRRRVPTEVDVFGVDLLVMQARLPGIKFIQGDFSSLDVQRHLRAAFAEKDLVGKLDVVVSDMCPNRGHGDAGVSAVLNENAIRFAANNLKHGGHFVCKVLGGDHNFPKVAELALTHFATVHRMRPDACRRASDESFLVACNKLEEPRSAVQLRVAHARGDAGRGPGRGPAAHHRVSGNKVKPVAGAFGLDDWPGAQRRLR